ncbi:MAG: isoprenylcysteine carboxylmethyltransferase family protein [Flavobacteriaceae bacterium]|nr:isoprenylcysteine carboxylmethyltransferase family protein [Flavobacteriaceae bacterium]
MIYLVITNNPIVNGVGSIFQALGAMVGIWGILTIKIGNFNIQPEVKSNSLITTGPYKWIRNPMYLAVILFFLPIIIQNLNWLNTIVFVVLLVTLFFKVIREEEFLEERFGNAYREYKKRTKRLIPYIF